MVNNRCVALPGYYESGVQTAPLCPGPCFTCTTSTFCTACWNDTQQTRSYSKTVGWCVPLPGFFENNQRVAGSCTSPCTQCTSSSYCTACASGYAVNDYNQCEVETSPNLIPLWVVLGILVVAAIIIVIVCIIRRNNLSDIEKAAI